MKDPLSILFLMPLFVTQKTLKVSHWRKMGTIFLVFKQLLSSISHKIAQHRMLLFTFMHFIDQSISLALFAYD